MELLENEIRNLQAIYFEDIKITKRGTPMEINITVKPFIDSNLQNDMKNQTV